MDPLTLVIALLAIATVVGVGSGVRVAAKLLVAEPGPERDALLVSRWSLAGSMAIGLSIAMGLPVWSLPVTLRWTVLGGAVVLIAIGTIESRRLATVRRQELAREVDTAVAAPVRYRSLR